MPTRKHVPAAASASTRARATAVGKQATGRKRKIAGQGPRPRTRSSVQDGLVEALPDPDKILRKPKGKRASNAPEISDSAKGRAPQATDPRVPTSSPPESIIGYYQAADSENSAYSVEEDPLESWYANVGYFPVLDESAFDVLKQVLPPLAMSDIMRTLYRSKGDRTLGLYERNVRMTPSPSPDPFLTVFRDMKPLGESYGFGVQLRSLPDEVKKHHVDEWRLDLDKAIKDELEATFQRTVMMSMLDRYRLMYNLKDGNNQSVLDFAVESVWNCPFMPTRALNKDKPDRQRVLSRPKPDISVAFHLPSIIEEGLMRIIPDATRRIMTYEAQDGTRTQRAFHFLMIEAKNADKSPSDKDGKLQSLNSASQSLHCLYEFFNEADRQEVECRKPCCAPRAAASDREEPLQPAAREDTFVNLFFKEVRVFTAVPTGMAITIRVHRAYRASDPPFPSHEGRPPFQPLILPDYPLQFEYNDLVKLTDGDFTRERLVDTFEKIMVDYGIGRLRPLLQRAAVAIATKFFRWQKDKGRQYELGMRHYSHGQTAPPPSEKTSRAPSQATRQSSVSSISTQPLGTARPVSSSMSADSSTAAHLSFAAGAVGDQQGPPKKKARRR